MQSTKKFASMIPSKPVFVLCILIVLIETSYYDNLMIIIFVRLPLPILAELKCLSNFSD